MKEENPVKPHFVPEIRLKSLRSNEKKLSQKVLEIAVNPARNGPDTSHQGRNIRLSTFDRTLIAINESAYDAASCMHGAVSRSFRHTLILTFSHLIQ